jgi:hypothetical protein
MDRVERSRNRASHVATEMNFGLPSAAGRCIIARMVPDTATEMNFGLLLRRTRRPK